MTDKRIQAIQSIWKGNVEQRMRLVYANGELFSPCVASTSFTVANTGMKHPLIAIFDGVRYDNMNVGVSEDKYPIRLEFLDNKENVVAMIKEGLYATTYHDHCIITKFNVTVDHLAPLPHCDCGGDATYGIDGNCHAFWCSKVAS